MKNTMKGTPVNLFRIMHDNRRVCFYRLHVAVYYIIRSLLMVPFSLTERIFCSRKIRSTPIRKPPLIILGHYRSGTTYLHKLLVADKRWGYINTFNIFMPYAFNWMEKIFKPLMQLIFDTFKLKHVHFHDYNTNFDDPLEEDMYLLTSLSVYSAFLMEVFPKDAEKYISRNIFFTGNIKKEDWADEYLYCLKRFTRKQGGKRLILKNPPSTGRIRLLLELFPDAKFVFIYRNPYQVYYSTRNLWKNTLEKYYALHKISDKERDDIIFMLYNRIMHRYLEDRNLIPAANLVEVRYEALEADPAGEIRRIYTALDLPGYEEAQKDIHDRIRKEHQYTKYNYSYDDEIQDKIYQQWGYFIDKWNYDRLPASKNRSDRQE